MKEIKKNLKELFGNEVDKIRDVLNINIDKIKEKIEGLSINDKKELLESFINELLFKLKDEVKLNDYKSVLNQVEEIIDYFHIENIGFISLTNLADDLYYKVNSQNLTLPIDIESWKKYAIPNNISEEDFRLICFEIIIRYIIVLKCLNLSL